MKIESIQFGTLEIEEELLYEFDQGLFGLEEHRLFALFRPDSSLPFAYLQAANEPHICLLLADPFAFHRDYEFDLPSEELSALKNPKQGDVGVWVTVRMQNTLQDATVNLLAPLVLNTAARTGRQVVLHNWAYSTRSPLLASQKEDK